MSHFADHFAKSDQLSHSKALPLRSQFIPLILLGLLLAPTPQSSARAQSVTRLYGIITTVDGDRLEGFIRWDKNEGSWDNVLDGTKHRPKLRTRDGRRKYRDRDRDGGFLRNIFGRGLSGSTSQSGIAFGHVQSLEPSGGNSVVLILKGGNEVELEGGSTDIGDDIREIVIEDQREGELELEWDDIESIEFSQAPSDIESSFGKRLYGTVTTRRGVEFTGFIGWDYDESFETDVLDGYSNGRKRKLRFKKIKSIARHGSSGAEVTTTDGKELRMEDSNDVDSRNNGIVISVAGLGRVVVPWKEFDIVEFSAAPKNPPDYDSFDGGRRIHGTVTTDDDETFTGDIIWDADEEFTWEILDGEMRNVQLDIFFGNIRSIERERRGATVTLKNGATYSLRSSNDIDEDNKGIYVRLSDDSLEKIEWEYFLKVEFDD